MKYHGESIKLLGFEPQVGKKSLPDLPESVAEWYSFEQAGEILKQYSNQDQALPPYGFRHHKFRNRELVVFMIENQGVCWWAFEMSKEVDPPVYVNLDPPPNKWRKCCESFSIFVYTRIFDFRYWCDENLFRSGISHSLSRQMIKSLRQEYYEHPTTHGWPGDTHYRFSNNDQRIVIHDSKGQSDWYFSAESPQSVEEICIKYKHLLS